jgi:hypothetical protein
MHTEPVAIIPTVPSVTGVVPKALHVISKPLNLKDDIPKKSQML